MDEPPMANAVLTFVDSDGCEWLAAAHIGTLSADSGDPLEPMLLPAELVIDRALSLSRLVVMPTLRPNPVYGELPDEVTGG